MFTSRIFCRSRYFCLADDATRSASSASRRLGISHTSNLCSILERSRSRLPFELFSIAELNNATEASIETKTKTGRRIFFLLPSGIKGTFAEESQIEESRN